MKKRGELATAIGFITFLIVTSSLVAGSYIVIKDNQDGYVGDSLSKVYYGFNCLEDIPKDYRVFFQNSSQAEQLGFEYGKCN